MFWIKTQDGYLINLANMKEICVSEEQLCQVKKPFIVRAFEKMPTDWWYTLAEFETKEEAQNYLEKMFEILNGIGVYNG